MWNTAHNAGPFVRESITDSLLSSQLFLAAAALTSLVLAAVTAERTRAGEALVANEERLRSVVHSMAEGLIVRDADGVITDCNAAAEQILGRSRRELRGHRPEAVLDGVVDADGGTVAPEQLLGESALRSGAAEAGFVAGVPQPGGERRWVAIGSAPVLGRSGRPEGVVTTLADITERREAEQRLVDSERTTRVLAEEQAALRRIATLVAAEATPGAVFERVTKEVGSLLGVPSASLMRYGDDRRATAVATFTAPGTEGFAPGTLMDLDGDTVVARVYRSGHTERVDSYEGAGGAMAHRLRALGFRSSVAAPVTVGGGLWGALVASTREPEGLAGRRRAAAVRLRRARRAGAGQRRRARRARRLARPARRGRRRRAPAARAQPPRRRAAAARRPRAAAAARRGAARRGPRRRPPRPRGGPPPPRPGAVRAARARARDPPGGADGPRAAARRSRRS